MSQETVKKDAENLETPLLYPFDDSWLDPCLEFAFKTLTGAIPIEDNIAIQGYFQQQDDTSNPQTDGCLSLPEIGLPNFFQSNISSDFATVGKSVSVLKLPENETKVSDRGGEKKEQKREKEAVEDVGRLLSMVAKERKTGAEKCNPWGITESTQLVAVCRGAGFVFGWDLLWCFESTESREVCGAERSERDSEVVRDERVLREVSDFDRKALSEFSRSSGIHPRVEGDVPGEDISEQSLIEEACVEASERDYSGGTNERVPESHRKRSKEEPIEKVSRRRSQRSGEEVKEEIPADDG
ncbi:hypothetical protein Acr_06g0002700 [Actinidia rufa]|uniref:Uncharacterized protein n=1 Tax=Actinidia rufa TaxID=165716 RepID=A0A7J0EPU9_9ERIC|nr:hypothetical protein Acr_06g0002700 [Actinidia rufa]